MKLTLILGLLACCIVTVLSLDDNPFRALSRYCPARVRQGRCRSRAPRCPRGAVCIGRYCCGSRKRWCPLSMKVGPSCGYMSRKCPTGYRCIGTTCCGYNLPPRCPNGQRPTTRCSSTGTSCGVGYSCTRGWCCKASTCPKGWTQGSPCDADTPCPKGYICRGDTCCKSPFVIAPATKCPKHQLKIPGSCIEPATCPRFSKCYRGICCSHQLITFPSVLCPIVDPTINCVTRKDKCETNSDCGKFGRCCEVECGRECRFKPVLGVCPALPEDTIGTCDQDCDDCEAKGQLCCSNGCGHECKHPVKPIKPAVCPAVPDDANTCVSGGEQCTSDADCLTGYKCCDDGVCGDKTCKQPVPFPGLG